MAWRLEWQQKNTLANQEKKVFREGGKETYKKIHHTRLLQAIVAFATVTNLKRPTAKYKKITLYSGKKLLFTALAHPASTPHCTHVQTPVDATGLCVQAGSQTIFWHTTHHCTGEVLYRSGLNLPGVSSSYSCLCLTQEQLPSSQRFSTRNCFLCCATIC